MERPDECWECGREITLNTSEECKNCSVPLCGSEECERTHRCQGLAD